jgi:hypothetical protein
MSKNQLLNANKASDHFAHVNEYLKNQFIIYGESDGEGIYLLVPRRVATVVSTNIEDLASPKLAETIHYTKTTIQTTTLPSGQQSELNIVNKDGIYETLVWTTTPENIKAALRAGVFDQKPMQNPLAKMIAQLGEYKKLVFSRSIEDDMVVKHNQEKLAIVDITQKALAALVPLYCSINNYDEGISPAKNLSALIKKVTELSEKISELKKYFETNLNFDRDVGHHLDRLIQKINHYRDNLLARLKKKNREFVEADMLSILRAYANPLWDSNLSLQNFLQEQLNTLMNNALELNYTVSGLFQDTSGLHKVITETAFIAESFSSARIDYHNPFTEQHAFDFTKKANAEGLVTLDMSLYGFAPTTKLELARQIAIIKHIDAGRKLFRESDKEPGFLNVNWAQLIRAPLTLLRWWLNGIKDIVGTAADIIYIMGKAVQNTYLYVAGKKTQSPNFPSGSRFLLKTESFQDKYANLPVNKKLFAPGSAVTKIPYRSLLQQLYSKTTEIIERYFVDPLFSISNLVVAELWQFKTLHRIIYDSTIGSKPIDEMAVALLLEQRISEMRANEISNGITQASLIADCMQLDSQQKISSYEELEKVFIARQQKLPESAVIPYRLTPDLPNDAITWGTDNFIRSLIEVFSHEIYRGHPVAGLAFTTVGLTAAPMVFPALSKNFILAAINKHFSVPLAEQLIGDTSGFTAGASTAVLQGQITYFAVDMLNGRDSTICYGAKTVFENPIITILVAGAAVSFGYAIAHELSIPWLSNMIEEETGKAAFPWFGLGTAGAKIAAILVESTLNLHKEQNQDAIDQYIDNAIDRMRPEIEAAVLQQYLEQHGLAKDELSESDLQYIQAQANLYCDKIKTALKKPEFSAQVMQLNNTINAIFLECISANPNNVISAIVNLSDQRKLATYIERREKRQQIAALDPKHLSEKDKYIIINYLNQTYPDHQDYVAAVREHLMQEEKMGPLAETFKILLNYPSMVLRATFAAIRTFRCHAEALIYWVLGNHASAAEMRMVANNTVMPVQELFRKIKNDLGLLIKGVTAFLRIGWGILAGIMMMPLTAVALVSTIVIESKIAVKIFSTINWILFAPGRVSHFINMVVGVMRADAGVKDLRLVTRDMDIHYNRKMLNPMNIRAELKNVAMNSTPDLTPTELENTVVSHIKNILVKFPSLKSLMKLEFTTFQQVVDLLSYEITNRKYDNKDYIFFKNEANFKNDLQTALLLAINKIKLLPHVSFESSMFYQRRIMNLIQANRRDPIVEFEKAYEIFSSFALPVSPKHNELKMFYDKLLAAQKAILELPVIYSDIQAKSNTVIQLLEDHHCLSLQSVREISRLRKVIQSIEVFEKTSKVSQQDSELPKARRLLMAFELIHKAARVAAHRLAVDPAVLKALTRLHVLTAPASTATLSSNHIEYSATAPKKHLPNGFHKLPINPTLLSMGRAASSAHFATVVPLPTATNKGDIELTSMNSATSFSSA